MRLRVQYHRPGDLLKDHDQQFKHGGLLVRVEPPADLKALDKVELEIEAFGQSVVCQGQVAQIHAGAGVAVLFDAGLLAPLIEAARAAGEAAGQAGQASGDASGDDAPAAPPEHTIEEDRAKPRGVAARADDDLDADTFSQYKVATPQQKIQMALRGSRAARNLAIRDVTSRQLGLFVLRNPNIGIDEVVAIARMNDMTSSILAAIAERRDWAHRPDVALALVRNPKTPIPIAVQLVAHLDKNECRRLGKDNSCRTPIKLAAVKRLGHGD